MLAAGDKARFRADQRLLILGGTAEAVELARACAVRRTRGDQLARGRTRRRLCPGEVRIGGFGGAGGLARFWPSAASIG